jgi:murein DD-endopeptidase MepM/ murein hydrolase activator NlpD
MGFNPQIIGAFWTFKKELKIVGFAFLVILLMPVVAVIILVNTGINIISDKLASVNEITKIVQIHDPATGEVIKEIDTRRVWPVKGVVTLNFGEVDLPYQPLHTGIDIASRNGKVGDPVTAFMPGKVLYAGEISWGYGKHIIIDHGDNVISLYGHLDKIFVAKGDEIKTTTKVIGLQGRTGWATGVHTHFEIRVFGIPVNPRTFLEGNPL